ncbi:hypothetical protein Q8W71_26715 [Methylobacterium sp. NEAU 140]|uniref:hypothetical protein n=1 Tax=Methylobacterium sp. NEAU 140 TaxID=3064945 RepID=UPI0027329E49|nr:hypothetical protein [Methylobacterium sp. NEAU 140]MDP4026224.1 hypothetical protein [Methylobacterium sp. NEAU 140]
MPAQPRPGPIGPSPLGSSPVGPSPFRTALRTLPAGLALIWLAACAQEGDFGRPKASAWNALIDATGTLAARERGGPASASPFTDDEETLRNRAWRFLMPAFTWVAFTDVLANLTRARVLPPSWRPDAIPAYHADLMGEPFRSTVSRYRRLADDAVADARLIPLFVALASRVLEADARRLQSLPYARTLDDWDIRQAAMRVAENRCLIAWVRLEAGLRLERYRYALEHLFAEAPGNDAVMAERAVAMLTARRALLDPLLPEDAAARCGLVPGPPPVAAASAPLVVKY